MSAKGYNLAPPKVVIDEPIIYDSLVKDFKELVDEEVMQDRKETEKAWKAATKAAMEVKLDELEKLQLSYRDICEIDNLQGLKSLTYLCLDNNKIPEITNIDHLVNLTWLDLSFNCITEIKGLETLTKLKDLTLFNNFITEVSGLNNQKGLHTLSLGNNKIEKLDQISKLREFTQLKSLNFEGNPVCKQEEYRAFTLAHLESIEFLDYSLIGSDEVVAAKETFQDEMIILQEKEAMAKANADRDAMKAAVTENLRKANMIVVETMYNDMFKEDQEMLKLTLLPGIKELLEDYQEKINEAAEEFQNNAMVKYKERVKEEEGFKASIEKRRVAAVKESHAAMRDLIDRKNEFVNYLQETMEDDPNLSKISELMDGVQIVCQDLIAIEVKRLEGIEKIAGLFENRVQTNQKNVLEFQNEFFRAVEDAEGAFNEALTELAEQLTADLEADEGDSFPVEVADLLGDKDALTTCIQASNDIHIGKLLGREDELRATEIGALIKILTDFKETKFQSNRDRIKEINDFKIEFIKELRNLKDEYSE